MTAKLTQNQITAFKNTYLELDSKRLDLQAAIDEYNTQLDSLSREMEEKTEEYNRAVEEWNNLVSCTGDDIKEEHCDDDEAIEWADKNFNYDKEYEGYYFESDSPIDDVDYTNKLIDIEDGQGGKTLSVV